MSHTCHAVGCRVGCQPEFLMCRNHWKKVPRDLQAAVYRHYRVGQCADKRPSVGWLLAANRAVCWVALAEGTLTAEMVAVRLAGLARRAGGEDAETELFLERCQREVA